MSRNMITLESTNGRIKVVEYDFDLTVEFGRFRVEYDATNEDVTVYEEIRPGRFERRVGTGPTRKPERIRFASDEELRRRGLNPAPRTWGRGLR
jgi:hypothetical protein